MLFLLIPLLTAESCIGRDCWPQGKEKTSRLKGRAGKTPANTKYKFIQKSSSENVKSKKEIEAGVESSTDTSIPMEPHSDEMIDQKNSSEQTTNIDHSASGQGSDIKKPTGTQKSKAGSSHG